MNSDPFNLHQETEMFYFGCVLFNSEKVDSIPVGMSKDKNLLIDSLKREIRSYCGHNGSDPNDERWEIRIK